MLSREQIANIIMDRCEEFLEYEYGLGICNSGTAAYKAADDILALLNALSQPPIRVSDEHPMGEDPQGTESRSDASAVAEGQTP